MRWGIYAPSMKAPRVLVLGAAASRPSQAVGLPDPLIARIADEIRTRWDLPRDDVHADVLAACGPSTDARPHEVAACSQRLYDQLAATAPLVVVFAGAHAARLARLAGLVDASGLRTPTGHIPVAVVRGIEEVGVDSILLATLGKPSAKPAPLPSYAGVETILWSLISGTCGGMQWRPRAGDWKRAPGRKPKMRDVEAHVRGAGWLAPLRPHGAWPYCVIDVDVHNAIQARERQRIWDELRGYFPNSLFFESSSSGGFHVYVRLPPDTPYAEGALWLAEFLEQKGLLFTRVRPARFASQLDLSLPAPVASRLVEVPLHPPRLPFGAESVLLYPLSSQPLAEFIRWLSSPAHADYSNACAAVVAPRVASGRWPTRAKWARTYMADLELASVFANSTLKPLSSDDPWSKLLPYCSPSLTRVIVEGCPAFGTRTGLMHLLADALAELVEPEEARGLFHYWIRERRHYSEEIATSPGAVAAQAERLLDGAYKERGGVPSGVWTQAEKMLGVGVSSSTRRAAFHVLRLFYRKGRQLIAITSEQFGLGIADPRPGHLPVRRPHKAKVGGLVQSLRRAKILTCARAPNHLTKSAGEYKLNSPLWPAPKLPGPTLYQCPP